MMQPRLIRNLFPVVLCFMCTAGLLHGQESEIRTDYNTVYRFPFSLGAEYQFVSPMAMMGTDYQGDFSIIDFSLLARYPIPKIPVLKFS